MALSLRLGNVTANSAEGVLREAVRRRDKTVTWLHPDWPILPGFGGQSAKLKIEKPGGNWALGRILTIAGPLAGILGLLTGHDVRRGAAYDVANGNQAVSGIATDAVARSLGHSNYALKSGTTDLYVGSSYQDHWSHRVQTSIESPKFDLKIARAPYVPPQRLSNAKITELCHQQCLDPSDLCARQRVGVSYRKEHLRQWIKAGPGSDPYGVPHTAPMPDERSVAQEPSSSKKGPWRVNMYDDDESDGKAR